MEELEEKIRMKWFNLNEEARLAFLEELLKTRKKSIFGQKPLAEIAKVSLFQKLPRGVRELLSEKEVTKDLLDL